MTQLTGSRSTAATRVYLIERFWPGVTPAAADAAIARLGRAASALGGEGVTVRHLHSALLPDDEVVLSMVEAGSLDTARRVSERAGYQADRISEGIDLGRRGWEGNR